MVADDAVRPDVAILQVLAVQPGQACNEHKGLSSKNIVGLSLLRREDGHYLPADQNEAAVQGPEAGRLVT